MTDIKYVKINILNLFDIKSNNKKYPLNFDFTVRDKKNKNFSSNGIYFITEKKVNKIVYIGIMLSKDLKSKNYVHADRFNKHLETLTLRGSNVGIKAKKDSWFNKCNKINPELYFFKNNIPNKDTGTTSDLNRVSYANLNWKKFSNNNNLHEIISNHFNLHYFKVSYFDEIMTKVFNNQKPVKFNKKNFLNIIQRIEDTISKKYEPFLYVLKKNKKYPYKNQDWRSKIFEISEIKNKIRNLSSIELSKLK
jgi:hypothetical protein